MTGSRSSHYSRNLAGETVQVDIFQDVLTLDYHQERLSRYSVEWQPDDRHFSRVGSPRLYDHRYQSVQLELWQPGEVEWFVIIRESAPVHQRKRRSRIVVVQIPLFHDGIQGYPPLSPGLTRPRQSCILNKKNFHTRK